MTTKFVGGLTAVATAFGLLFSGATGTAHAEGESVIVGLYFTYAECDADAERYQGSDSTAKCLYNSFRDMYELHVWNH